MEAPAMYPKIPLSEWPADQQRRLALEAVALFEPILRSLGFDPADAQARAKRYLDNLDNRLRELGESTRRFPARTAFITRYAPKEIASRHFDSQAPGAFYWTWLHGMLCVHWGKNFRLLLDPTRRSLSLETAGTQAFQAVLDLPPHAVRAIADAWRPDILHGLLERKQENYDDSGNRVGQMCFLSSGNDEWAAVETSYRLYDTPKPPLREQDPQYVRRMERIEAERKKIEQLGDRAGRVAWEADWQSAFAKAKAEAKPVMVDFTGDWCGWCRRLDEITFRDPTVAELSTHTVNVKVDDRKDRDLHARSRVFGIPDVRFYSPDEGLLDRSHGFSLPEDFVPMQRRAIAGRSHLAETRLLLRGEPPDPLAAADLLAFCKLVPPEEEVAALSILCEAIRNGNERVIGRFERGTDWLFLQRAAALLEALNWAGALAATAPDAAVVKEQESRARLAQLRTACLYVLGRREEAENLAAHTAREYGEQYGPFDGRFLYDSSITDWP